MMTIEEALALISETVLVLREQALLAEGEDEIRAEAAGDALEQVAKAIRGEAIP